MKSAKHSSNFTFAKDRALSLIPRTKGAHINIRATVFIVPLVLVLLTSYWTSSGSSMEVEKQKNSFRTRSSAPALLSTIKTSLPTPAESQDEFMMITPQSLPSIAVYDGDCTTPKSVFNVGDTVCAVVTGIPVGSFFPRRLTWESPDANIAQSADVLTDPQNGSLGITATFSVGTTTVDSRGAWRVVVRNPFFFFPEAVAEFIVVDSANATADVGIASTFMSESVQEDGQASFGLQVTNYGPDSSVNIQLTNAVPANTSFVSFQQLSGPTFTCESPMVGSPGMIECSITGLAANTTATFVGVFEVNAGVTAGTEISNHADIASVNGTNDQNPLNNSTQATTVVSAGAGGGCTLTCPANVVLTANTTSGGQSGAFVTYSAASVSGDCGAVTNSPASGSFFAVGTHTVTSSSEVGGASCFFTVTVLDTNSPTIACPANVVVTAPDGATEATVNPGAPTINASGGGTITAVRSDDTPAVYDDNGNIVTPAVVHVVTDPYPVGNTGILWTVTDAGGRTASCSQTITVVAFGDRDPVTIMCPANVSLEAPAGTCETTIPGSTIGIPSTIPTDNVTVVPRRSDDLPLSAPFPAGATLITWTATDSTNGNVASCVQTVTVTVGASGDTTPPVFTVVPQNVTTTTSSCTATLDDELGTAEATDTGACGGSVTITRTGIPPNFVFPTGTTTITYTATDAAGNTATVSQLVTVTESPGVPPTITAPPDVSVSTGAGATVCGTVVSEAALGSAIANDNCPGVTVMRTGVPVGNLFPVGNTTITYTATDASGNTATDTQVVTVTDDTVPVVTAPGAVTLFTGAGATSCSVTVQDLDATLGTGSATDNCPGVGAVTRIGVPSGNVFPVGPTPITYSATDAHGNVGTATQVVTVVDNTQPVISCPSNIVLEPTCPSGAIATYSTPTATDNCGVQAVDRTAGPASGSIFSIGITTVTHTATDIHGNTASCSFTVTVLTPQAVIQNMIAAVNAIPSLTGQQRQGLLSKLQAALDAINDGKTNVACNKLNDFISQVQGYINNGTLTTAQGQSLILSANHVRNTIGCTSNLCT